jgi:hypothetical protein
MRLPDEFLEPFYYGLRKRMLELVKRGLGVQEILLGLTLSNPCMVTYGSEEYPNGAIKSVVFFPKKEYLESTSKICKEFIHERWDKIRAQKPAGYEGSVSRARPPRHQQIDTWKLMLREMFLEPGEAERKMDFTKLGTLEGLHTHTWSNIKKSNKACLLYWIPPSISFEVRCTVEIQEKGPYHEFLNYAAFLTHGENPSKWKFKQHAYIFNVEAVFDNSPRTWNR